MPSWRGGTAQGIPVADASRCLGCHEAVRPTEPVCQACATDPFAMEDARVRAAFDGNFGTLAALYGPPYAYLPEGKIEALWEDNLLGAKDTIPEFSHWRCKQSVRLVQREARRILDVGVGSGSAMRLLQAARPDVSLYGVDLSARTLESVSRSIPGSFAVASIEDLPWADVAFDAILLLEVLEHVEVPRTFAVLGRLRRRLAPAGALIVSVPLHEDLRRSYFPCLCCGQRIHQIGHVRTYTPELVRAELAIAGYRVDRELPLAGGTYFGIRRQHLMPLFPTKIQPMVLVVRARPEVDAS